MDRAGWGIGIGAIYERVISVSTKHARISLVVSFLIVILGFMGVDRVYVVNASFF